MGNQVAPTEGRFLAGLGTKVHEIAVVVFHAYQALCGTLPPAPASPGRFYTSGWSTANRKPLIFVATDMSLGGGFEGQHFASWLQFLLAGPLARFWRCVGARTPGETFLCLCLPVLLGSCLLCLYREPALMKILWCLQVSLCMSLSFPVLFHLRTIFADSYLFMMLECLWCRAKLFCCDKTYVRDVGILDTNDFLIIWIHIACCWKMRWARQSNTLLTKHRYQYVSPLFSFPCLRASNTLRSVDIEPNLIPLTPVKLYWLWWRHCFPLI